MNQIIIFTDGASRGNPGPGGWGVVIVDGEKVLELGGREDRTTNNRMEMMSLLKALEVVKNSDKKIKIFLDSGYVLNGATKWVEGWQNRGWITSQKEEVLNRDLWEKISELLKNKNIEWKLIPGHAGIPGNERVDEISTDFADNKKVDLYSGDLKNYFVKNILNVSFDEKKLVKKNNSKLPAYSYISMIDGKIEIHKTWAECEKRVKGKNAKFKKAVSAEDEKNITEEFKKL
jgi:ribonuclease HI